MKRKPHFRLTPFQRNERRQRFAQMWGALGSCALNAGISILATGPADWATMVRIIVIAVIGIWVPHAIVRRKYCVHDFVDTSHNKVTCRFCHRTHDITPLNFELKR